MPPPNCSSALTAASISASLSPATIILCESCEIVVANAPLSRWPEARRPFTSDKPTLPVAWCRSMTATLTRFRQAATSTTPAWSTTTDSINDLVLRSPPVTPMMRACPEGQAIANEVSCNGRMRTRPVTDAGSDPDGCETVSSCRRPFLKTARTEKSVRFSSTTRSAA